MVLQVSGPISMNDIKGEFGGSAPDAIEEYYRGGGLVTENNTNIPSCGTGDCLIDFEDFYGGELLLTKIVSSNVDNLVLSTLFTEAEWSGTAPKEVIINAGVTVGSNTVSTVACRTGTTVNAQPMGGTLKLINNGNIYGAGGAGATSTTGGVGGNALEAEVLLTVQNNNRIYSGGGGGGKGGVGCTGYYYPDTTTWRFQLGPSLWNTWDNVDDPFIDGILYFNWSSGCNESTVCYYELFSPPNFPTGTSYLGLDGRVYERGAVAQVIGIETHYYIRRRNNGVYPGGAGGNGGIGQGAYSSAAAGAGGSLSDISYGGQGGTGGGWGTNGGSGASGVNTVNNATYAVKVGNATAGYSGGLAGFYIVNNGNVTWEANGLRLGRVG